MAIFNRLTEQEIQENFTHYGMFCFIAPVYCNLKDYPRIVERNWFPDWIIDISFVVFFTFRFLGKCFNRNFECKLPIKITGKIERRPET
jgi:hypothetical protein